MDTRILNTNTNHSYLLTARITGFFLLSYFFMSLQGWAQTIGTYTTSTNTTATMDAMTAPTTLLVGSANDDSISAVTNFSSLTGGSGFVFLFDGIQFTSFSVSSNGLLRLGSSIGAVDSSNSLATTSFNPKIAPYWDNLHTGTVAGGGKVHCKIVGSSPNRKLVVEWFETVPRNAGAAAAAKFQAWLFENGSGATTPNVVEFVYGSGLVANGTMGGYSIGIVNTSASGDFWSVTTSANTFSSSAATNNNTSALTSGRFYMFTPPAVPACASAGFSPANNATGVAIATSPLLSWTAVSGATGYDVYLDTASAGTAAVLVSSNQSGTTYTPGSSLLVNQKYFWKIIPRNAGGAATAACSVLNFTTLALPSCPTFSAPANNATAVSLTPGLTWTAGAGGGTVASYDVYFGTSSTPPFVTNVPVSTLSYSPGTLAYATDYWWRIVAKNSSGASVCTTAFKFTTILPPLPVCPSTTAGSFSPANGAVNIAENGTLTWTNGSGGGPVTSYDVYIGTTNPPAGPTNILTNSYSPPSLALGTKYYWRVASRNAAGPATGCQVDSFTTLAPLNYDVTRTTGITYTTLDPSTSTKVSSWKDFTDTDDNLSDSMPIGFNFTYQGITRTKLLISTNGFITFKTTTNHNGGSADSVYGPDNTSLYATGGLSSPLVLSPFWEDLVLSGSDFSQQKLDSLIRYQTTGSAPNRVFTVEWKSMETYGNAGPDMQFQVKLYETTNNIEFVYGKMQGFDGSQNYTYSYTCGINAAVVSSPQRTGETFIQQIANTRSFALAPPALQLSIVPECNSKLLFTPGNYTAYVPGSSVPVNDEPAGAIALPSNDSGCVNLCGTYYSTAGATANGTYPACAGAGTADVWFSFIATSPTTTIKVRGSGGFDGAIQLYNNALTSIACQNSNSVPGMTETMNTSGLTVGNQYYLKVYNATGGIGVNGTFSICINATPTPPVNDNCSGAINLAVSATLNLTLGTNTKVATASTGITSPCGGTNPDTIPDDDVWYSFIAPGPLATVTVQSGSGFDAGVQVFSGNCGALTSIKCVNLTGNGGTETANLTNLTNNAVYYVRVYHARAGAGSGIFSIGITSPIPGCPAVYYPPNPTSDVPLTGITFRWSKVSGAASYDIYLDTLQPPVNLLASNVTDTSIFSGNLFVPVGETFYWQVVPKNGVGRDTACNVNLFAPSLNNVTLQVKVLVEGLYKGHGAMYSIIDPVHHPELSDSVRVSLFDITPPYDSLFGWTAPMDTNGVATCIFPFNAFGYDYYFVITHRNSMKIWSYIPITYERQDSVYNFTVDSASETFMQRQARIQSGSLTPVNLSRYHSFQAENRLLNAASQLPAGSPAGRLNDLEAVPDSLADLNTLMLYMLVFTP